ncbi:MAG: poly(A) polymerase, partial [Candidatus Magasanikbacteria bacterium]|nr:poly(A) polymerase [Candidatus Magasanikbacteria bacterium]
HDIGKPETAKKEKDSARPGGFHISFHGHEKVGAVKAEKILRRMKVSAAEGFNIKVEDIVWLAQNHLLPNSNSTAEMRPNTIKKYFLDNGELGRELMQVALVDAMASLRPDGGMDLDNWKALWKKLEVFKKIGPEKNKRAILSGDEVMKALKIKPGKQVGEILAALTDEQLSGRIQDKPAAIAWLRVRGQF